MWRPAGLSLWRWSRDSGLAISLLCFRAAWSRLLQDDLFMNEPVVDWCRQKGLEVTRSLAYRKNDHAWVELKNGTIASHRIAEYYLVAVRY